MKVRKLIGYMNFLLLLIAIFSCAPYTPIEPIITKTDSSKWGSPLREIWKTKKLTDPGLPKHPGDSHARTTPYINGDRIIFGYDSVIDCININSGERIWSAAVDPYWNGQTKPFWDAREFIIENGKLYALMGESKIICLDLQSGNRLWLYDTHTDQVGRGFSQYSHSSDAIFITLYNMHSMIAVSKSNGGELWRSPIPFSDHYTDKYCNPGPATYLNGRVYCGFSAPGDTVRAGGLVAFDAITGKLLFFKTLPPADSSINFSKWKMLIFNNTDAEIFPFENDLIFSAGYSLLKTDSNGNILWRSLPIYNGGVGDLTQCVQLLSTGNIYGHANGGVDAFAYSVNATSGNVMWTSGTTEASSTPQTTVSINGAMVDGTNIYKVSDVDWLIGQDIYSGKITWDSDLTPHIHSIIDNTVSGGVAIEGKRVYFLSVDSIYCMERTDKP